MQTELSKKAMLVTVNMRMEGLLGERRDREASELVSNKYKANSRRTKTAKYLIDRQHPSVKRVVAMGQRVRDTMYRYTFPWGGTNLRLLPVKAHVAFEYAINEAIRDLKEAQAEYIRLYPALVAESKQTLTGLGHLYDPNDYPTQDRIAKLFTCGVEYWPIPDSGHFVADIAQEAADDARKQIVDSNTLRANQAVNSMLARVEETVGVYVDKLSKYRRDTTGSAAAPGVVGIFRDSLVSNVKEIANLVRLLNFSDDVGIDQLATQIDRLAKVTAESLRENDDLRTNAINDGRALIAKLAGYRKTESVADELIGAVSDYY
jgi:hypothetical protein